MANTDRGSKRAIERFLHRRNITGSLDWTSLFSYNLSPARKAADLKSAMDRAIDRFLRKVHFDTVTGHWDWTGTFDHKGYSRFTFSNKYGKRLLGSGHRFSYSYFRGPIPEGLHLDHLCGFRECVNPFHMEAVTLRENSLRQARWAKREARQPRCIHGHKFPGCYPWPKKNRTCLKCLEKRLNAQIVKLRNELERVTKAKAGELSI
jgi:hypothetical protein